MGVTLLDRRTALSLGTAGILAAASALFGCGGQDAQQQEQQAQETNWLEQDPQTTTIFAFDTVVSFKVYCSAELLAQASERCQYFEQHFSRTVEGSDIWNINNAGGAAVEVAQETADIIGTALEYCKASDGLFDISIGAVSSLWDFVAGIKPEDKQIKEAVKHVDYRKITLEGTTVTLQDPDMMLDLGGVAKGYIADDLARMFRENGCESGYIDLGGNIYVLGHKPDGSAWNVGIQDPNDARETAIAKVACADMSVVTSGLYERQFEQGGKTYYHILDPKTGYPAKSDLLSSSVLSESSLDGDAYATWMFLLGSKGALDLLEKTEGMEGMVIDEDNKVKMTSQAKFEMLEN